MNYYAVDPFDAANLNIHAAPPKPKAKNKSKVRRLQLLNKPKGD